MIIKQLKSDLLLKIEKEEKNLNYWKGTKNGLTIEGKILAFKEILRGLERFNDDNQTR